MCACGRTLLCAVTFLWKLESAPLGLSRPFRRKCKKTQQPGARALLTRVMARAGLELLRCRQEIVASPQSSWVSFASTSFTPMPPAPVILGASQRTAWFQKLCMCTGKGVSYYGGGGSCYGGMVKGKRAKQDDAPLPKFNAPMPLASRPQHIANRRCAFRG